ncbi:MAG: branched-chain amino acid ABC transporter permease [Dehalococcoidia bacterium]
MSADQFFQYLMSGLTQGSIYALIGLGFTIIYAVTQIINFAQGEFVMLGGMLSYVLAVEAGLPMPLALIIAIVVAAVVGAAMYLLAIRTARRASVISLIIITIGAAIFIRGIAGNRFGVDTVSPPAFTGSGSIKFLGAYIEPQALWIIGITFLVTILLYLFLSHTMVGKALRACAVNPGAASLVGINTKAMALIAFIIAGAIGGIGGIVIAPMAMASYNMGVMLGLKGFVAAAVGGFMSPITTVIGGIVLGIVENLAIGLDWGPFTSAYKDVIALVALLLILLIRSGKLAAAERAG